MKKLVAVWVLAILLSLPSSSAATTCRGDCDGNGRVTVDELVYGVRTALSGAAIENCRNLDTGKRDGMVDIAEILAAIHDALVPCADALCGNGIREPGERCELDSDCPIFAVCAVDCSSCIDPPCTPVGFESSGGPPCCAGSFPAQLPGLPCFENCDLADLFCACLAGIPDPSLCR